MHSLTKTFPPYAGDEPYMHLCFAEESAGEASALLRRLRMRGVRVWYCMGNAADRKVREENERRMLGARVTAVYLDEAFRNDPAAKSRLLTCQREGQPVICLNTDGGDGGLSIGLHADAHEVKLRRGASAGEAEESLLRAEGFTQELIGEPAAPDSRGLRILTGVLMVLIAAALAAGAFWYAKHRQPAQTGSAEETEEETDSVRFADETLREIVRDAAGGGSLTEDKLARITALRLPDSRLPDDLSDLTLLRSLEVILISQTAARDVPAHPELAAYVIELYGGGSE